MAWTIASRENGRKFLPIPLVRCRFDADRVSNADLLEFVLEGEPEVRRWGSSKGRCHVRLKAVVAPQFPLEFPSNSPRITYMVSLPADNR